jgi:hypothetical protein
MATPKKTTYVKRAMKNKIFAQGNEHFGEFHIVVNPAQSDGLRYAIAVS